MDKAWKIRLYGGLLTLFGLFAVYSTSIWKSFDQRFNVTIIQNIETIKAYNTFLDETILKTTENVIQSQTAALSSQQIGEGMTDASSESTVPTTGEKIVENLPKLPVLELGSGEKAQLVLHEKTKVQGQNNYYYFSGQIRNLLVSLLVVLLVAFVPLPFFKNNKFILLFFIAVFGFQLLVFVPGIAATNITSRGRVDLPGLPNMQPSEFFKLGYIFFMSYWITKRREVINDKRFLLQFGAINAIVLFIILAIPDMGTLFILAVTGVLMAWFNGLKTSKIMLLAGCVSSAAVLGTGIISIINPDNYALVRLKTFFTTDEEAKRQIEKREGWQNLQGLIAIGGGGIGGQGYGRGLQKMGQLPEAHSDMIFAAFSEEIGFIGNMVLFALYIGLFLTVLQELRKVRDPQLKTLAVGAISLIIVQVFVHVGVNLQILPNTGLTLPFVSHGGTALMINLVELMILYKILKGK